MPKGMPPPNSNKNWRHANPNDAEVKLQKKAMAIFIVRNKLESEWPKASVDTYRKVLPILAELMPKWSDVKVDKFN